MDRPYIKSKFGLTKITRKKPLDQTMHYRIWSKDSAGYNFKKLKKKWRIYDEAMREDPTFIKRRGYAFIKAVFFAFQTPFILVLCISVIFSLIEFFKTFVMYYSLRNFKRMVNYTNLTDLYLDLGILVGGLAFS